VRVCTRHAARKPAPAHAQCRTSVRTLPKIRGVSCANTHARANGVTCSPNWRKRGDYFILKFGGRFSLNASGPSLASSLRNTSMPILVSILKASFSCMPSVS
jgi:hypothetical protein